MKDWFKDRGYPHFSSRTPFSRKENVESYISKPKNVARHSFYPLIFKTLTQRRYKKTDLNGIEKRSHKTVKSGKVTSNKKIREILYATHIDAHIYSFYTRLLSAEYEQYLKQNSKISDSISAYRQVETMCKTRYKNNIHFAKDVFDEIRSRENCVALAFDIENFFPSLDHKLLKLRWAAILGFKSLPKDHYNVFKSVTNFSYVELQDLKQNCGHFDEKQLALLRKRGKSTFFNNIKDLIVEGIIVHKNQKHNQEGNSVGIPQGLPISALLANLYMLPFDKAVIEELAGKENVFYRRYSDDIVVICREDQIEMVEGYIKEQIENIKLIVSLPKTEITLFRKESDRLQCYRLEKGFFKKNIPLNYLGFEFYGYQTLLKSKNVAAFYREMKSTVKRKYERTEKIKQKELVDSAAIFKRKIYRLYSFKGEKTRLLPSKKGEFMKGKLVVKRFDRKYRGNYLRYAYRASDEMNAPEIKRQLRSHWKILQMTMKKYEFFNISNGENGD